MVKLSQPYCMDHIQMTFPNLTEKSGSDEMPQDILMLSKKSHRDQHLS